MTSIDVTKNKNSKSLTKKNSAVKENQPKVKKRTSIKPMVSKISTSKNIPKLEKIPSKESNSKDSKSSFIKSEIKSNNFFKESAQNLLDLNEATDDPGFWKNDEVYDEVEQAQYLQLCEMAEITRRIKEMNRPQTHPDFDGIHCIDCDISIPPRRLEILGCIRCVDCQDYFEKLQKRK